MSKRLALTLAGVALMAGLPGAAWAQLYVAAPPTPRTAPVYTGWQESTFLTSSGGLGTDSGVATLALPFSFSFYGKSYTTLDITTDGLILFENGTPKKCTGYSSDCSTAHTIPNTTLPNAFIAYWWADMETDTSKLHTTVVGAAPNRIYSIKIANWHKYSDDPSTRSVQIDLHETSGAIEIFYGALAASATTMKAAVGIEDSAAANGVIGLACTAATGFCTDAQWPAGQAITIAPAVDPELSVVNVLSSALVSTTVNGLPGFQTDVTVKVQNLGQNAASNFLFDLYLCNQTTVVTNDPSKCVLVAQHTTPETVAGKSAADLVQTNVQFVRPGNSPDAGVPGPTGSTFYIGAHIDPPTAGKPRGDVLEPIESNNTGVSMGYIAGVDLDGSLTGPSAGGPGDEAGLDVVIRNRGLDPITAPFTYELWVTTGAVLDRNKDSMIWPVQGQTATIPGLGAGESVQPTPPAKLPTSLPNGTYRFLLVIDPTTTAKPKGDVIEVNEANNTILAPTAVVTSSADLTVENLKVRSVSQPYPEITEAFFDTKVRASVKLTNAGGAAARNFDLCFYISDTPLISPFDQQIQVTDPVMSGLTYVGNETHQLEVELTLPKYKKNNASNGLLDDGQYYIGVIADCFMQVAEGGNKSNNRMATASTLKLRQPAADLAAIEVQAPAAAAVGEVMPVYRVLRNLGVLGRADRGQPGFPFRYYLSSNETISPEDIPLSILVGSESKTTGEVWLAPGDVERLTDQVIIPWDVSPGTYYVGLVLDPGSEIPELDETNNGLLSLGTVEVAAGSLRVETGALPDALVWVDYLQQLVASGGDGTYAWSLVEGQGALPAGLSLEPSGLLSGRPEAPGVSAFTVKVVSAGRSALARLALRAVDASGPLTILSSTLPTAIVGIDYTINLAAIGGVRPYVWRLTGGELPAGLSFAPDGQISGRLAAAVGAVTFQVSATDAYGAVAVAELSLRGVSPNTLSVKTDKLKEALVGSAYQQNLEGQNGKEPYAWAIEGTLPDGLRLVANQIVGTPTKIGSYQVVVELTDADGFTDKGSFILTVRPKPSSYTMPIIPEFKAGDVVDLNLGRTAKPKTRFALYSGRLPPGLALAADGKLTGTVAMDAAPGSYDSILDVLEESGATALLPLTIRIVAPEYVSPVESSDGGCSAGGGGLVPLAALLGLLPLLARRRRAGAAVLGAAIAAVGLAAAPAHAGYRMTPAATAPFAPLINGTPVVLNAATGQTELTLPFGVRLYGSTYGAANVSCRGYLAFDKGSANLEQSLGIPSTNSAEFPLIAPWWGRWDCAPDSIVWAVSGVAPSRVLTLQWTNVWYALDTTAKATHGATFQVKLYETTGKIEFLYGPSNQSAYQPPTADKAPRVAVGIQSGSGPGMGGLSCTTQQPATGSGAKCQVSDYPSNSVITFAQPVDLVLARVYSDALAYPNVPLRLGATVHNQGGEPARNVLVRFYASTDAFLDTSSDRLLGTADAIDLAPAQKREVTLAPTFPADLAGTRFNLFAVVDPDNAVSEDDEGNNSASGQAFSKGGAIADLVAGDVVADRAAAKAGDTLWLTHAVRNIGNGFAGPCALAADCGTGMTCDAGRCRALCTTSASCPAGQTCSAGGFCDVGACSGGTACPEGEDCVSDTCTPRRIRYGLYLSDNEVITAADRLLTPTLLSLESGLAAFGESLRHDQVTLPADLAPGAYYLGVIVSPDGAVPERLYVNNFAAAATPISVGSTGLSLVPSVLPAAVVQAPYAVQLRASGGDGSYQFAMVGGVLPAGLTLSRNGVVAGIPLVATATPAELLVSVTSAGKTATANFLLEVQPANLPLAIVSREIPAGEYGKPYSVALAGVGGKAPYAWSANASAPLPPGLSLAPEGRLEGVPSRDGEFTFKVEVQDAAGNSAAQILSLLVVPPDRLQLATRSLPEAYAGKSYSATVRVVGGRQPYTWAITEVRALSTDPTAVPGTASTKLPSALQFDSADQALTISGIPAAAGSYVVTIKVSDPSGLEDNSSYLLNVRDERGLQVTTMSLPDAIAGKTYAAALAASAGEGTGGIAWSLACTQRYDEAGAPLPCAATLPPGISLSTDGSLATAVVVDCHLPTEAPKGCPEGLTCSSEGRCVLKEPEGRPARTIYSFMVKATEEKTGRTALRALSITLRVDAPLPVPEEEGGCSAAGGGTLLPAAAALLALLRRRRSGRAATALSAAGLVLAVGLAGVMACGGGDEKPAPTRCDHVTCPETLACDPGDGVCKCGGEGGMLCAAGGACSNGVCVYACPGAAACTGGSALDPLDCQCKCGGKVCAAGQLCDTASRTCITPNRCDGVACAAGLTCDPSDGVCKCGGAICPQGQACVAGACTASLCAGVQCAGATLCDPADGVCKCGGAAGRACSFGEACECPAGTSCEVAERRCAATGKCAGKVCGEGSSCDPADGVCRCGGPGGPECLSGQTCDVLRKLCVGGNRCAGVFCGNGLTCDPDDGACKCGGVNGANGAICAPHEICGAFDSGMRCVTPCDPRQQSNCGTTMGCYFDMTAKLAYCALGKTITVDPDGTGCKKATDCARGYHCQQQPGQSGKCRKYCDTSKTSGLECPQSSGAQECKQLVGADENVGACDVTSI